MTAGTTKIVLIDDEEDLCFLLSNMLKAQGYDCSAYYTLNEGMAAISGIRPQWVIIDNDLPDGRGWDCTDEILRENPGINVIKISANPDSQKTHTSKNVHYLIKPIHVNSITGLIRETSLSN
jgi:DNA-binding NtrC family response regulator